MMGNEDKALALSIDGGPPVEWQHIQQNLSPMGLTELRAAYWQAVAQRGMVLPMGSGSENGSSDAEQ